jgi:ankyrin repeat protein
MIVLETKAMRRADGGERGRKRGFRLRAGAVLVAAAVAASFAACAAATSPRSTPPESEILSLPGFRISPPSRRGWRGEEDRPSRTASFSKKYSGFFREWLEDEAYADILVKPLFVPPALWTAAGEELLTALKTDYAEAAGLGPQTVWKRQSIRGRRVDHTTSKELTSHSPDAIGLWTSLEDIRVRMKVLRGLFFPPDLERTHRYFEIWVGITELNYFLSLHDDLRLSLLDALVKSLEMVGPFEGLPGPSGSLARAVLAGDAEAARKAVEDGADAEARLPDWTPFEMAAFLDRRDLAGILDRNGGLAAIFDDPTALRPFLLALVADRPDIAAFLLDHAAAPLTGPTDGPPPLALAAGLGYVEIVTGLLERGADVDALSRGIRTPLVLACESGAADCAEALMAAGAGLDLRSESGGTALHTAVDWGRPEIVRSLIAAGADVNVQDNEGWSPLHVAAFHGDAVIVGELLAAGARLDLRTGDGRTALAIAEAEGKRGVAGILLKAGAKKRT